MNKNKWFWQIKEYRNITFHCFKHKMFYICLTNNNKALGLIEQDDIWCIRALFMRWLNQNTDQMSQHNGTLYVKKRYCYNYMSDWLLKGRYVITFPRNCTNVVRPYVYTLTATRFQTSLNIYKYNYRSKLNNPFLNIEDLNQTNYLTLNTARVP
jgi:hypothetical protein